MRDLDDALSALGNRLGDASPEAIEGLQRRNRRRQVRRRTVAAVAASVAVIAASGVVLASRSDPGAKVDVADDPTSTSVPTTGAGGPLGPRLDPAALPPLPTEGVVVETRDPAALVFVGLDGKVLGHLPEYDLAGTGNDGAPDATMLLTSPQGPVALDVARHALRSPVESDSGGAPCTASTPGSASFRPCTDADTRSSGPTDSIQRVEADGRTEAVPLTRPQEIGGWRYVLPSPPGDRLLAEWSGECEAPTAYLFPAIGGAPAIATGPVPDGTPAPASEALGWASSGEAIVSVGGECGGTGPEPGLYLREPGSDDIRIIYPFHGGAVGARAWKTGVESAPATPTNPGADWTVGTAELPEGDVTLPTLIVTDAGDVYAVRAGAVSHVGTVEGEADVALSERPGVVIVQQRQPTDERTPDRVEVVRLEDDKISSVATEPGTDRIFDTATIDGRRHLLYATVDPNGDGEGYLYAQDLAGGARRQITYSSGPEHIMERASFGGGVIAGALLVNDSEGFTFFDLEGQPVEGRATPNDGLEVNSPGRLVHAVLSPDGTRLAYLEGPTRTVEDGQIVRAGDWHLVVIDALSGTETHRLQLAGEDVEVTWLDFDGRWVTVSAMEGDDGPALDPLLIDTGADEAIAHRVDRPGRATLADDRW